MNVFQSSYEHRLREWSELRKAAQNIDLAECCTRVDAWWQQAPLVNHHLHHLDTVSWPDPWTLLSDNTYCTLTRAVGICYTLLMAGIQEVNLVVAKDSLCEDHNLVIVGGPKYVLNYHPGCVLSTNLKEFEVSSVVPIDTLYKHIK